LQGTKDAVFVSRGKTVSVIMNPRQYERGALLIIPNQHASSLIDTHEEPFLAAQIEARRMARLLVEQLGATGVNVFQNAGVAAGQTVPHYHVHVVPRYPSSDPARRFREADYDVVPKEQLRPIADILSAPRDAFLAQFRTPLEEEYERKPRLWWFFFLGWMALAITALVRLITATDIALGVSSSVLLIAQTTAVFVFMRAISTKSRRRLRAGYGASILIFVVSLMLTF
jgi:diadenosine tetraphosphate (Ap4A) HIT family hydrolase